MNAYPLSSTAKTRGQPAWHTSSQLVRASLTAACGVALTLVAWVVLVMLLEHRFRAYDGLVWSSTLWLSALVCTGGVAYSRITVRPVWASTIAFALFGLTYVACEGPIFGAVSEGGDPSMTQFVVLNLALLPLGVIAATDIGLWLGRRHCFEKSLTMKFATYTPGHSENVTEFMARRTIESHGEFFLPYLMPDVSVLDCGCGPGSITLSIASRIGNGRVVGVDFGASQIQRAMESAKERGIANTLFQQADCYSLPFEDASFDRVFSNALMEHLTKPVRALCEMHRVLKPGGMIGVSSPDWAGFVLAPPSDALTSAVSAYTALQTRNGGDVNVSCKLGTHLKSAGFENCQMSARYEVYPSLPLIGEYLAIQLEQVGDFAPAATFRSWSRESGGLYAQCWVSCVAQSPLK